VARVRSGADGQLEPVFLLGPARSGTSLLYRALCLHPEAGYISNYVRRAPWLPELAALNRVARSRTTARRQAWFGADSNAYVYNRSRTVQERLFPAPVEGETLFAACGITQYPGQTGRPRAEQVARLRSSLPRLLRAGGGSVLVNKRIANNRRVPLLLEAFPRARFVRLIRDGRAVALSLSQVDWWLDDQVWWAGTTPREWARRGGDPWEICARNWVEEVRELEHGLAAVPGRQVLSLSYEEFVADPHRTLAEVAAFGGLPASAGWEAELRGLSFPDRNDGWRTTLEPDVLARIEAHQHELLQAYGYLARITER
jgi:omega-hydroxy-beta-dihydromenaquinone-9 sulfotransferase